MADELEFIYNTRLRSANLQPQLSEALVRDFQSQVEADENDDVFENDGDDTADYVPEDDASDIENDLEIEPNELYDSDEDVDEEEESGNDAEAANEVDSGCFYGKDGTKWNETEPPASRLRQHNIMRFQSGTKTRLTNPVEVFKLFFSTNITFVIISETNRHGRESIRKWNEEHPESTQRKWIDLTSSELDAFIGILLASGLSHNNMQDSSILWRSDSLPIFRAAMSHKRFITLSRYIRFDNSRTRAFRQQTDKAAPIRDIWNFLNENLQNYYEPYENITIDEQLFPYRGRTKFTQYIPSKPARYGIKVWWACDAKTKFPLKGKLYTGKEGDNREINQGENVLMYFANCYANSGRTIISDNFFTSLNGAKRLAAMGLAFVGTIRANKRCLPKEVMKSTRRPILSSVFGFHENLVALCSYVPKKNKAVNLISTVHYTKHVEGVAMKPEAILFYNSTKAGVDTMDQMLTHYTTKRSTRRWTYAFFCNMIDVMALASYIICKLNDENTRKERRRIFLYKLAKQLVLANVENRINNPHIVAQPTTRIAFEAFFGRPLNIANLNVASRSGPDTLAAKKDCRICLQQGDKIRRKTRFFCCKCNNPVCQQHSKVDYLCFCCLPQNSE